MFLDLEKELRTNGEFKHEVIKLCKQIDTFTQKARINTRYKTELRESIFKLLRLTKFNIAPLLPFYFPKYPRSKPFSLRNFPYAYAMYNLNFGRTSYTVIRGSRQIIKSTSLATRAILSTKLFPNLRSMLICPRIEQLKTLGDKYKEVEQAYRFFQIHKLYRNNLYYKEYPNGSIIKMLYILTNADKVRGNMFDWIDYDEYQDFDNSLELEINEVLTQSEMPMITYTGTSKTTDSALELAYQKSSRGSWGMKCTSCNHINTPTLENDVFSMISPKGLVCSKCSAKLNPREGFWHHESPSMLKLGRVGLHVPKIIIPENVEKPAKWYTIFHQSRAKDKKKFLEEVLGIATQEGAREITEKDLEGICVLGPKYKLEEKAKARKYRYVISGCDWGGSDYVPAYSSKRSYTVHAVIGVTEDWNFDIIHIEQYSGMKYEEISELIVQTHNRFKGFALASDFGVGAVYNNELRKLINPNRHVIFNYVGPKSSYLAEPSGAHLFNQLSLNRTEAITNLYADVKSKRLRCYSWEESGNFLLDFMNLIRTPDENVSSGNTALTYRKHGDKTDDVLHAINFAVHLAKLVIGDTLFEDEAMAEHVLARIHTGNETARSNTTCLPLS